MTTTLVCIDTEIGEFRRYERHEPKGKLYLTHHACIDPELWDDIRAGNSVFDHDSIFIFRANPPAHMAVSA